jgi:hypothetical protein
MTIQIYTHINNDSNPNAYIQLCNDNDNDNDDDDDDDDTRASTD